jgi:peroxiredoxin
VQGIRRFSGPDFSDLSRRTFVRTLFVFLFFATAPLTAAAEIFASADDVRPRLPGQSAPAFRLLDVDGTEVSFETGALERPVVLTFYRGGWCPYCNLHLAELRTVESELRTLGFDVWFVSPDRPVLLAEGEDSKFGYRLLSDPGMNAAQSFGIASRVDEATNERYLNDGVDLEARAGDDLQVLPAPATFIVGSGGTIQFTYVNPDYSVRLAPEVLLAAARAYSRDRHERLRAQRGR